MRRREVLFLGGAALLAGCGGAEVSGLPPPQGRFVEVAGRRVHLWEAGQGPSVVLVHGASGNLRDFTFSLAPRLARRYRVVAVDRPGLGYSDSLHDRGESPAEQAAVLEAAVRSVGVDRAVIVGHSYGGAVAMAWALDRPESAAAVVSLCGAVNPWPGDLGAWYRISASGFGSAVLLPLVAALAPRGRAEQAVAGIFAPQPVPAGYIDHIGVDLTLRAPVLRANARQVNGLRPHVVAMSARYPDLRLPVEIVHGDADTTVPLEVHSRPLSRQVPGARLTVLPGVGHMPHHADEDAAVAAIDRAVARAGL